MSNVNRASLTAVPRRAEAPSARKLAANRANALRSTGPRTAMGKAVSRRNARRHGLSRLPPPPPARVEAWPAP